MTTILAAAASGLAHYQQVVDVVADNVANVSTPGFKATRALAHGAPALPGTPESGPLGVRLTALERRFAPGALQASPFATEVALRDDAFLVLQAPDGTRRYTRAGTLRFDSVGNLVGPEGLLTDPPIVVPGDHTSPSIDAFGRVTALSPDGETVEVGRLQVARFVNPSGLISVGGGLFVPSENAGAVTLGSPGGGGFAELAVGFLEASNVSLADELTTLIVAQRAYSASAQAFRVGDDMLATAARLTA